MKILIFYAKTKKILEGSSVSLPTTSGVMEVRSGHEPMVVCLSEGAVTCYNKSTILLEKKITKGMAHVKEEEVILSIF
ncbi:MAG: hypothetical protein OXC30_02485 [Alphaproteobacteria bacterium]|nr:hypothetical protein [Alphaproteobacteria bacterium]